MIARCIVTALLAMFLLPSALPAQTPSAANYRLEEIGQKRVDMWSVGLAWGGMIVDDAPASFANELFVEPVSVSQSSEMDGFPLPIQISLRYGLDRYILPGLTVGIKIDYSFVNIKKVDISVRQQSNVAFAYQGGFLLTDTVGLTPHIEARLFTLGEQIFNVDLPLSWEIYLYGGPRFNLNLYTESKLKVEDTESFVFGIEIGAGVEMFIADQWSLRAEVSYYTNGSSFTVHQSGLKVLSGDLELGGLRVLVGLHHYF